MLVIITIITIRNSFFTFFAQGFEHSKKTCQNVAGHTYMESFLSRVTGKTFPWLDWSPFDEFFVFRFEKRSIALDDLNFGAKLSQMYVCALR